MRILMLVLASDSSPEYLEFQAIWKTYMKKHPNIDCYFYKGYPNLEPETFLTNDTLYIKIEESFETVYEKTLRAFEYFEPRLNNYDFVYRTNLSSFVDFKKYLMFCQGIPKTNFCAAYVGYDDQGPFPSGSGFTLSTDIVRRLVKEKPPLVVQDDITIGHALLEWGIPIYNTNRRDYVPELDDFVDRLSNGPIFHYRVKSTNRKRDAEVLRRLVMERYFMRSTNLG